MLIAVVLSMVPAPPTQLADICKLDANGNILPSKTASGKLSKLGGIYFIDEPGNNATTLYRCTKGGCGPMKDEHLLQGHTDAPVRAEFCGTYVARLFISDSEVFRLTQQDIAQDAAHEKRFIQFNQGIAVLCGFWLLLKRRIKNKLT
ncbi:hypothetical protein AAB992_14040 [Burkholderia contaminans]|uniref:hypothetical protein n=1 Tax=Burkholderia contaminans TaxID=488447 RepID=UPI00241803C9|nr:hypothetical protein [Burkholderia contaminans]WFN14406.1 hypothetical protein LXE92_36475 [Burkholderia contaminans]